MVTGILHCHPAAVIQSHDNLHGFCMVRGTGTTPRESNMLQQLMAVREEVLYEICLDLHKAYDSMER